MLWPTESNLKPDIWTPTGINLDHPIGHAPVIEWIGGESQGVNLADRRPVTYPAAIPKPIAAKAGLGTEFVSNVGSYIDLSGDTWLTSGAPYTFAVQLQSTGFAGTQYPQILALKCSGTTQAYQFFLSNNGSYSDIGFGSNSAVYANRRASSSLVTGRPFTIVIVFDGGSSSDTTKYSLWVDGSLKTLSAPGGFGSGTGVNRIGFFGGNEFIGYIFGIRFFNNWGAPPEVARELSLNYWAPFDQPLVLTNRFPTTLFLETAAGPAGTILPQMMQHHGS